MNKPSVRIEISKLCKSFAKHEVLRDVDWSITAGSVVGLLGTNGAGKTTLIQCLLGLLRADSGRVMIDGEDAWDLSAGVKARIGYVDQRPRFYPWLNGSDLLKYVGAMYPRWNAALCAQYAKQWDVPLSKPFGKLSPGEQQKIAILMALGNEPDLLILDEPVKTTRSNGACQSVDAWSQLRLFWFGTFVIGMCHGYRAARSMADRRSRNSAIAWIRGGCQRHAGGLCSDPLGLNDSERDRDRDRALYLLSAVLYDDDGDCRARPIRIATTVCDHHFALGMRSCGDCEHRNHSCETLLCSSRMG